MQGGGNKGKTPFSPRFLLVFSILLGSFLRFYKIGSQPLWLDEAWTQWLSSKTMLDLWTVVPTREVHPPFYYAVLKIWILFGSSEAWLRSLSAVMSIGCIPLVFMIGRFLGKSTEGEWLGAGAALMFAVSPVNIQYAQEVRPYAMLTFAATLTLCACIWIMRHPEDACEPLIKRIKKINNKGINKATRTNLLAWMITAFAIALTLWLHNTSILFIVTILLVALIWFSVQLRFNRIFLANILITAFIVCLLWGPWLIALLSQTNHVIENFYASKPTFLSAANGISWLLFGNSIHAPNSAKLIFKLLFFLLLINLAAMGLWNIRKNSGTYISLLIVSAIFGPILLELLFSLTIKPIFVERTLIYVSVPFFIAIAAGLMTLGDSRIRVVALMAVSLIFLKWTYNYYKDYQKEPWDKIAHMVVQEANNGVVVFIPHYIEIPFAYYARQISNYSLQTIALPHPYPGLPETRLIDIPEINHVIAKCSSAVWLITRREDLFDDREKTVFLSLMQHRVPSSEWHFGDINIFRFGSGVSL